MTFEQFQAARRDVDDLGVTIPDCFEEPTPGFLYDIDCGYYLWVAKSPNGGFWAVIGNSDEFSLNIADVERVLYDTFINTEASNA